MNSFAICRERFQKKKKKAETMEERGDKVGWGSVEGF